MHTHTSIYSNSCENTITYINLAWGYSLGELIKHEVGSAYRGGKGGGEGGGAVDAERLCPSVCCEFN